MNLVRSSLVAAASLALTATGLVACDKEEAKVTNPSAEKERSKKTLDCTGEKWAKCLTKAKETLPDKADEAMAMYKTVCDAEVKRTKSGDSSLRGCFEAGRALMKGDWVTQDRDAAKTLFMKACEGDYAEACADVGSGFMRSDFGAPDDAKAAKYLKKACDLGHEFSCSAAAKMAKIVEIGRKEDWPRLCKAGNGKSCMKLAMRYYNASPKDNVNGAKYFALACDGGVPLACDILAQMYVKKWVEGGKDAAVASWNKGCALKNAISCTEAGMLEYRRKNYAEAFKALKTSCDLEPSRIACASLGQLYLTGKGTKKDPSLARAVLVKACTAGESSSCKQVDELDGKKPETK